MKIILTRHGLTAANQRQVYLGGRSDEPLCAEGVAALQALPPRPEVAKVYTSGLVRCEQSAALLYPRARRIACPQLREMDFGRFEGHNWQELTEDSDYQAWLDSGCLSRCPQGECRADFTERCVTALRGIVAAELEQGSTELHCLVHGGTIMALLSQTARPRRDYYDYQTPPGGSWLCELDHTSWPRQLLVRICACPEVCAI